MLANWLSIGGTMADVVNRCTHGLTGSMAALRIPATVDYRAGPHSCPYRQDDLHNSWLVFAAALGV